MTVEQKMLTPDEVEQALRTGAPLDLGDYIVWYAKGGHCTTVPAPPNPIRCSEKPRLAKCLAGIGKRAAR
jgi:hypothetical protein